MIENLKDKNSRNDYGDTPLHWAAKGGKLEICRLLINNIENKNPVNNDGETPFDLASDEGHLEICQLFS